MLSSKCDRRRDSATRTGGSASQGDGHPQGSVRPTGDILVELHNAGARFVVLGGIRFAEDIADVKALGDEYPP
jgi:hypothetical protein